MTAGKTATVYWFGVLSGYRNTGTGVPTHAGGNRLAALGAALQPSGYANKTPKPMSWYPEGLPMDTPDETVRSVGQLSLCPIPAELSNGQLRQLKKRGTA